MYPAHVFNIGHMMKIPQPNRGVFSHQQYQRRFCKPPHRGNWDNSFAEALAILAVPGAAQIVMVPWCSKTKKRGKCCKVGTFMALKTRWVSYNVTVYYILYILYIYILYQLGYRLQVELFHPYKWPKEKTWVTMGFAISPFYDDPRGPPGGGRCERIA